MGISSPYDDKTGVGKHLRPTKTDLGIGSTTPEQDKIIKQLMQQRGDLQVNAQKHFNALDRKFQERINRIRKQMGWKEYPIHQQGVELFPLAHNMPPGPANTIPDIIMTQQQKLWNSKKPGDKEKALQLLKIHSSMVRGV